VYDADTNTYSSINLTTTAGGVVVTGMTYTFINPGFPSGATRMIAVETNVGDLIGKRFLNFFFSSALTNVGGTRTLTGYEGLCTNAACSAGAGQRIVSAGSVTSSSGYTVTYNGNGATTGTVPVDASTYATGAAVTVRGNTGALGILGYTLKGWNTAANGSGTSYAATGAATFAMGAANVTLFAQWALVAVDGPSPTGTGQIRANITGENPGCGFASQQFIPLTGNPSSPPAGSAPPGVVFPHGLFNFTVSGCTTPGGTVTFIVTYPTALPAGTQYWKYGPTLANRSNHWYTLPAVTSGSTITFSITDGGLGDDDLVANGSITDPFGPGVPPAVPDMPVVGLVGLALVLTFLLWRRQLMAQR